MIVLTIGAVNKDIKSKEKFSDNHFNNILRLFDVLLKFSFTAREKKCDYC